MLTVAWIKNIICLKQGQSEVVQDANVTFLDWTTDKTLESILPQEE